MMAGGKSVVVIDLDFRSMSVFLNSICCPTWLHWKSICQKSNDCLKIRLRSRSRPAAGGSEINTYENMQFFMASQNETQLEGHFEGYPAVVMCSVRY